MWIYIAGSEDPVADWVWVLYYIWKRMMFDPFRSNAIRDLRHTATVHRSERPRGLDVRSPQLRQGPQGGGWNYKWWFWSGTGCDWKGYYVRPKIIYELNARRASYINQCKQVLCGFCVNAFRWRTMYKRLWNISLPNLPHLSGYTEFRYWDALYDSLLNNKHLAEYGKRI